jgi:hypothetical protein
MEIELGRIYTTMGDSIALPFLKYADKAEAFILYAADIASVYSPVYALYDSYTGQYLKNTGQYVKNSSSLDLFNPIYSLDSAISTLDKVVSRGWRQSADAVTVWDAKLDYFLELFREVY